jgi:hypothetical protein
MKFLGKINNILTENNINYEFQEWTSSEIVFPYWVGDYTETEYSSELGYTSYSFMLTGTTNKSWLDLEKEKEKIKNIFSDYTYAEEGYSLAIYYENSFNIPCDDMSIKRMQINLEIKEWN